MKRFISICILLFTAFFASTASSSSANKLKVKVSEFKVVGAPNQEELKSTLQLLFASRLKGENIRDAEPGEVPDLTLNITYIAIGKVFSLDAVATNSSGNVVGRGFEQGESADEVIPAISRLAQQFVTELAKRGTSSVTSAPLPVAAPVAASTGTDHIVKPESAFTKAVESGIIGQRLKGVIIGVAEANRSSAGERLLVAALEREIRLYTLGKELTLVKTLKDFSGNEKIIAIDTADLDGDGIVELYVTIFLGDELSSRVYLIESGGFRKVAENLQYFLRAMSPKGGPRKLYAQEMGREDDYYGGLYEVVKSGNNFRIDNQIKLPRFANIFNTNLISDRNGQSFFVVIHPDNFLLIYDINGELLWKSSDKFGGSETYFSRDDSRNLRVTGSKFRKTFLEQRITVTKSGTIIVPKNEGFFVVGDSRSFSKNMIYGFRWNGAALDELWHTKLSLNYLSDYLYDDEKKELLLVEVVKKEGVLDAGASAFSIKRVE